MFDGSFNDNPIYFNRVCHLGRLIPGGRYVQRINSGAKMDTFMVKEKLGTGLVIAGGTIILVIAFLFYLLVAILGYGIALLYSIWRSIINLLGFPFRRR